MCQPKSRGGQRCYGYALGRFEKAHVAYLKALPPAGVRPEEMPRRVQRKLAGLEAAFIESGITMASTRPGHEDVVLLAEGCARAGAQEHAGRLQHIAAAGARQREINAQVASLARVAQSARLEYAASGGVHTDDYSSYATDEDDDYSADDLGLTREEYAAEQAMEAAEKAWRRAKDADAAFERFATSVGLEQLAPQTAYMRSRAVAEAGLPSPYARRRAERDREVAERLAEMDRLPSQAPEAGVTASAAGVALDTRTDEYREDEEHWSDWPDEDD